MIAEMVELREAHLGDELIELYKQLSHSEKDLVPLPEKLEAWFEKIQKRGDQVFLYLAIRPKHGDASSFETIIGGAGTLVYDEKLLHGVSRTAHIEDVVVRDDLRGLGVGRSIVSKLVRTAKENGCYKISLTCKESLVPFYEGSGFTESDKNMVIRF